MISKPVSRYRVTGLQNYEHGLRYRETGSEKCEHGLWYRVTGLDVRKNGLRYRVTGLSRVRVLHEIRNELKGQKVHRRASGGKLYQVSLPFRQDRCYL